MAQKYTSANHCTRYTELLQVESGGNDWKTD